LALFDKTFQPRWGNSSPSNENSNAPAKSNGMIAGIDIRPLAPFDAQDLQRNCFPNESPQAVNEYVERALHYVKRGQAAHLVAEADGHAIANAQLICWRKRAEIGSLVVAEALRGRGIGTALIEALNEAAADLGVEEIEIGAAQNNRQIVELYRRLGFRPYKEVSLPGDKDQPERILYMVKPVPPRNHS
jgi:ribosomal protein S18 acetylase RimI-like enzyme